jgi:hypothetical protein
VKRATSVADGSEWAVKIIDKTKLAADDEAALKVEVEILQKVSISCQPLLLLLVVEGRRVRSSLSAAACCKCSGCWCSSA